MNNSIKKLPELKTKSKGYTEEELKRSEEANGLFFEDPTQDVDFWQSVIPSLGQQGDTKTLQVTFHPKPLKKN